MNTASSFQRRAFLTTIGTGAAAVCLAPLREVQAHFSRGLEALTIDDRFTSLRNAYSLGENVTYFNHASIGTMPRLVQEARMKYLEVCETNPWLYMWGPAWDEQIDRTRATVAEYIGCEVDELAITHNTTEGFNTLAHGLPLGKGDEVLYSTMNHVGARVCWEHRAEEKGFTIRRFEFPIERASIMMSDEIVARYLEQIRPETRVLVIPHIDNMVGFRYPVKRLAAEAKRLGVEYVAVDGAQSIGLIPVNVGDLGVDFYATSTHKWVQSLKGLGLFYVRKELQEILHPMWVTWGQSRYQGSARIYEDYGTRNRPEMLTLEDCVQFQNKLGTEAKEAYLRTLHAHFRDRVDETEGLLWKSPRNWEDGCSIFAIEVLGSKSSDVSDFMFEKHGYVFRAFGGELNALRMSVYVMNTIEEIDRCIDLVKNEFLR